MSKNKIFQLVGFASGGVISAILCLAFIPFFVELGKIHYVGYIFLRIWIMFFTLIGIADLFFIFKIIHDSISDNNYSL